MYLQRETRHTCLFILCLLLAGAANVLSKTLEPALVGSLMTSLNYLILTGLLLFWIHSVRVRLLPSPAMTSVLAAALLMLAYLLVRIFKYRFAVEPVVMRYAVYAYWIGQMLIPALFLMTCIRIRRGSEAAARSPEALLLIPASLLALTVMTNDLHSLVYVPKIALTDFALDTGTYTYGPVLYILYVWMALAGVSGLILLLREAGHLPKNALRDLLIVIATWLGMVLITLLFMDRYSLRHPFNVPETHIFGLLGIFEVCIRHRLIPHNDNYTGFFRALGIPVLVTDRDLEPVYRTETPLPAAPTDLKAALDAPVELPDDRILYGRDVRAGHAFWTEDESGIRLAQHKLREANELLEEENDLILAETEQKEKDAYLQSRHRIYHEIAQELYPVQQQIGRMLDGAAPGTNEFRDVIARVCILNAYVKRKTNLLLLASETDRLSLRELLLALQESAGYLTLAGLQTTALVSGEDLLPAGRIISLYDAFERIAEQLLGNAPSLMVFGSPKGLRLTVQTDVRPETDGLALPVKAMESDGILYLDIPAADTEVTA